MFQLKDPAMKVSSCDVRNALHATSAMSSEERRRYFEIMDIDYDRATTYVEVVEGLRRSYAGSPSTAAFERVFRVGKAIEFCIAVILSAF